MKTVVANAAAAHMWAHQTQEHVNRGRTGGSLSFSGRLVYSYSTCMGVLLDTPDGSKVYLLNSARYSVTTAQHQSMIRGACPSYRATFRFPFAPHMDMAENLRHIRADLEFWLERIPALNKGGKSGVRRDKALAALADRVAYASDFATVMGYGSTLNPYFADIMAPDAMANLIETRNRIAKEKLEREQKQQAEYELQQAERLEKWLSGSLEYGYFNLNFARLRISKDGETVETTQGATVPLEHVQKAIPVVLPILQNGGKYRRNGHTIHLGHYAIEEISDGILTVGCHRFERGEIERFAALLA